MPAYNGWYHLMSNTYGTWLPGDARGFRTRRHNEHIEGDYKNPPPPGKYDERYAHSTRQMKQSAVWLDENAQDMTVESVRYTFVQMHQLELLAVAVLRCHMHLLVRLPASGEPMPGRHGLRRKDPARFYMGIAKERSAKKLKAEGLVTQPRVWATRGKIVPIRDRAHQIHVYRYIVNHVQEGATVWTFRDGIIKKKL